MQVKSETNSAELADYIAQFEELESFNRMFFVYHSGSAETDRERVIVIGPEKLAEMAVDAGLPTWLVIVDVSPYFMVADYFTLAPN